MKKCKQCGQTLERERGILINVILDKSGSMGSVRDDTIGSFNTYVDSQKDARFSVTLFDTLVTKRCINKPAKNIEKLTRETYKTSGCTALYDAVGQTLVSVQSQKKHLPEKVLFVIITDGEENSSREFTREKIIDMIDKARTEDGFEFVFLGADMDAWAVGHSFGVVNTFNYTNTPDGVRYMTDKIIGATTTYASSKDNLTDSFFDEKS